MPKMEGKRMLVMFAPKSQKKKEGKPKEHQAPKPEPKPEQ